MKMSDDEFIAHLSHGRPPHGLHDHLTSVAGIAEAGAEAFGGAGLARLLGLWHDLGKYNPDWQVYIREVAGNPEDAHLEETGASRKLRGPNHSSAGALHAAAWLGGCEEINASTAEKLARVLAYPIMGHHAGLADFDGGAGSLHHRMTEADARSHLEKALASQPPASILAPEAPDARTLFNGLNGKDPSFFIRMLFSCLVDADFLDTEAYMDPGKSDLRRRYPDLPEMEGILQEYLEVKCKDAMDSPVNAARREVLAACQRAAQARTGYFSLIVPTGGGKTLSSLAFAMRHAQLHEKKRIIYAIPYTSIIEQTAAVFRDVLADLGDCVLEHHSNLDDGPPGRESTSRRLASENWDAPLIVTTTVQLFESLYANRPGRCRKLHNISDSVIILDEAHLMPPDMRTPILHALHQLVAHYGVTVVLCTATPTGVEELRREKKYIPDLRPIIEDPQNLYTRLKRVDVETRMGDDEIVQGWEELAGELSQYPQVLCIVNRRQDCRDLHAAMPEGAIHLSALMCAEHRSRVIVEIKQRLKDGQPVRVISTQLVEAGVDIDFPVVYRVMAGLDSIAQAAGRCNREGKLPKAGKLVVFRTARGAPKGLMRQAEDVAGELLRSFPDADILSPEIQKEYFKRFYGRGDGDAKRILKDCFPENREFAYRFREGAEKFRIIEDTYKPIIVRYENAELLATLDKGKPERWLLRKLQRSTVSLPENMVAELYAKRAVKEVLPGLYVQDVTYAPGLYDGRLGLVPEYNDSYPPADLIA